MKTLKSAFICLRHDELITDEREAIISTNFNPVLHIMIAVVHTGDYAVIQVKHRRDINLKLSVYF